MKPSRLWIDREAFQASLAALTAAASQAQGEPVATILTTPDMVLPASTQTQPPEAPHPTNATTPHVPTSVEPAGASLPATPIDLSAGPASARLDAFLRWFRNATGTTKAVLLGEDGLVLAPSDVEPELRRTTSKLMNLWCAAAPLLRQGDSVTCRIEGPDGPALVVLVERTSWGECGFAAVLEQPLDGNLLSQVRINLQELARSLDLQE